MKRPEFASFTNKYPVTFFLLHFYMNNIINNRMPELLLAPNYGNLYSGGVFSKLHSYKINTIFIILNNVREREINWQRVSTEQGNGVCHVKGMLIQRQPIKNPKAVSIALWRQQYCNL